MPSTHNEFRMTGHRVGKQITDLTKKLTAEQRGAIQSVEVGIPLRDFECDDICYRLHGFTGLKAVKVLPGGYLTNDRFPWALGILDFRMRRSVGKHVKVVFLHGC